MNDSLLKTAIIVSIACLWMLFDYLNIVFLASLKVNDFLYAIYWLAGFRLMLIILFGWIGVVGTCLGYALSSVFFRSFDIQDAIFLGIFSSIAPFVAYKIWLNILKKSESFVNVSFIELFYLILFSGVISAILRSSYLIGTNKVLNYDILIASFAANVSGSILFLFAIKALLIFYKRTFKSF